MLCDEEPKNKKTELTRAKRKKKKRKEEKTIEEQWRRKKKKRLKCAADLTSGSLYMCLITKMPLKTKL